jgi:YfiH family protein
MIEAPTLKAIAGIAHGYFTREGGHSRGRFRSLNCGYGSGDDKEVVARNRAIVAEGLGVAAGNLVSAFQVHSPTVLTVTEPWPAAKAPRADAMVTDQTGIAIAALTADCAPVIFAARDGSAVGIAHAGWKGALAGVTDATIEAMTRLGAKRESISAAIGPTIAAKSYEVGPELRAQFVADDPGSAVHFTAGSGDRCHFDLPGYLLARLKRAGVDAVNLDLDTYGGEEQFFSYRRATHRNEAEYGRLMSAVAIKQGTN